MQYWIYENWQAAGHTAKIHVATCGECQHGKGKHNPPVTSRKHGAWHGPFTSIEDARRAPLSRPGATWVMCSKCNPESE